MNAVYRIEFTKLLLKLATINAFLGGFYLLSALKQYNGCCLYKYVKSTDEHILRRWVH